MLKLYVVISYFLQIIMHTIFFISRGNISGVGFEKIPTYKNAKVYNFANKFVRKKK